MNRSRGGGGLEKFGLQPLQATPQGGPLGVFWETVSPCPNDFLHWWGGDTLPVHPHPPNHLRLLLCHHNPMQGLLPGGSVPQGGGGKSVFPTPYTGLLDLGLLDFSLHDFTSALQGVVAAGVSAEVTSSSQSALAGKVATLYLLHICFT